jgi:putative endonuclease
VELFGSFLAPTRPVATSQHCTLGKTGEDLACDALRERGYAILDRRYRTRGGELDVVARDGRTLVFVEVKTRRSSRFGTPLDAITRTKRRQIVAMAADYLARRRAPSGPCRFDVVAVSFDDAGRPVVDIISHAFEPGE